MTAPTTMALTTEVDQPSIERYPYGLLSVARLATEPDRRWEAHGVTYAADSCGPGGGVWPNPCERLPPGTATIYTVSVLKPGGVDQVYLTLTNNAYGVTVPVTVTVNGGDPHELRAGERAGPIDVVPGEALTVEASVAAVGVYPACTETYDGTVPATETSGTAQISCEATIPAQAEPTKVIANGLTIVDGISFVVYEGLACMSLTADEARGRAENRLALHEQYWLEREVDLGLLRTDARILNGGAATPMKIAVGLLEDAIAEDYGGVGTLHAARELGTPLKGVARRDGARQRTPLDNLWAFGAGYTTAGPSGEPAPAGQAWIYATGPVVVRRSEVQLREVFDHTRNTRIALAERSYAVTADCLRAAVLVTIPEE